MDGRLVAPAVCAWLAAAVAGAHMDVPASVVDRHDRAVGWAVVAAVLVAGACSAAWWRGRWRPAARTVCLVVIAAGVGVGGAAAQATAWTADPVAGWIDDGATARIVATVRGEPETRSPPASVGSWVSPWSQVRIQAEQISARGRTVAVSLPLVMRTDVGVPVPAPGTRVVLVGRLAAIPLRSGAAASVSAVAGGRLTAESGPGPVDRAAHAMRVGLRTALSGVPPDAGSLVAGLAVGDESGQSDDLAAAMRTSGLSHLTAVSGGNIAIVLGAVLLVCSALRIGLAVRVAVSLMALAFFVTLVGPQASVLRAAAMGSVAVVAVLSGGRRAGPSVLCVAIIVLVVDLPWLARSWAFTLSASATAGIVLLAPTVQRRLAGQPVLGRLPPALRNGLALTLAAQVATLPALVAMGGASGWVAVPANLLAMPVVPAITILGLLAAGLSPLVPDLASVVATVASWPAAWVATVAHVGSGLPGAVLPWPAGPTGLLLLGALAMTAVVASRVHARLPGDRALRRRAAAVVAVTAAVLVTMLPPARRGWPPEGWLMVMCDVGQGDALVLPAGGDSVVVVDTGPDPTLVDRCLADLGAAHVPVIVLTHFHADHVRGLSGAFHGRDVGEVLTTNVREPEDLAAEVTAVLGEHGVVAQESRAGEVISVGPLVIRVLWPRRLITSGSVPNNASVVLDVAVRGRRLLLMGDVEPEAQAALQQDLISRRFDVVKVPHHGSRHQAPDLTRWAPAPIALISVGAGNDYGHPAPETIASWRQAGAIVLRTDVSGDIAVVENGSGLGVVARGGMLPPA